MQYLIDKINEDADRIIANTERIAAHPDREVRIAYSVGITEGRRRCRNSHSYLNPETRAVAQAQDFRKNHLPPAQNGSIPFRWEPAWEVMEATAADEPTGPELVAHALAQWAKYQQQESAAPTAA